MNPMEDTIETESFQRTLISKNSEVIKEVLEKDYRSLKDTDIAEYFLKWYSNSIFYNCDTRSYHIFDGKYYKIDSEALLIKSKIKDFLTELVDYANNADASKNYITKIYSFKEQRKIKAIAEAIKTERRKEDKDIDTDVYLFNCQNGILDLSGDKPKLINHSPKHLITQISDVEYKPKLGEVTGEAKELLLSFFIGNEDVLNFMFEYLGVSLTGYAAIRKFIYAFGSGKNGKSTFFNFFLDKFFNNYGATINYESFTKDRNHNGATSDLVRVMNKRLTVTNESKDKLKLNTTLIKTITGGDHYQARLNYENERSFVPKFKIIMFGNNQLTIDDSSSGMIDRFIQVPFLNKFKGDKSQREIWDVLKANKSQILNSLIAGYYRYIKNNCFNIPETVKKESLNGFTAANNFIRFFTNNLKKVEGSNVKIKEVFGRYKKFIVDEELSRKEILKRADFINNLRSSGAVIFDDVFGVATIKNYQLKDENSLFEDDKSPI